MSDARSTLIDVINSNLVGGNLQYAIEALDALDTYLDERHPIGPHDSHTWIWASSEAHPSGQTECAHCEIHIHDVAAYEPCPDAPTDDTPPTTAKNPADASEPRQSERTGSDELAYASCLRSWGAAMPTNEASRDVYRRHLERAAELLEACARSRTEREAGERVEGWATHQAARQGDEAIFVADPNTVLSGGHPARDFIETGTLKPATLILRSPSPRVPENEGGKP